MCYSCNMCNRCGKVSQMTAMFNKVLCPICHAEVPKGEVSCLHCGATIDDSPFVHAPVAKVPGEPLNSSFSQKA